MRTQVGIVGAGPAGLALSHLLHLAGIDSVVLESRSREHVEGRQRAGVLEHGTAEFLDRVGLGRRMQQLGMIERSIAFRFNGASHPINFSEATGGRFMMVYPQHEVVCDLIEARLQARGAILFDSPVAGLEGLQGSHPTILFESNGRRRELVCDFVAGCDGFHGVCRNAIPETVREEYSRIYPFAWLGILAEVPAYPEITWCYHSSGFAMISKRTPTVSRIYLQCPPEDRPEGWSDDRIWSELHARLDARDGIALRDGAILQKGVAPMRSFVAEPMQYGRLFLAGDCAHVLPPTGAKGLNSAIADIRVLGRALVEYYSGGKRDRLDRYSQICLERLWMVQRFSSGLCNMVHISPDHSPFERRLQLADLEFMTGTPAGRLSFSVNFTGLPVEA
jgi:p-hydroxybenzoate 3-monooxygenase